MRPNRRFARSSSSDDKRTFRAVIHHFDAAAAARDAAAVRELFPGEEDEDNDTESLPEAPTERADTAPK